MTDNEYPNKVLDDYFEKVSALVGTVLSATMLHTAEIIDDKRCIELIKAGVKKYEDEYINASKEK